MRLTGKKAKFGRFAVLRHPIIDPPSKLPIEKGGGKNSVTYFF